MYINNYCILFCRVGEVGRAPTSSQYRVSLGWEGGYKLQVSLTAVLTDRTVVSLWSYVHGTYLHVYLSTKLKRALSLVTPRTRVFLLPEWRTAMAAIRDQVSAYRCRHGRGQRRDGTLLRSNSPGRPYAGR